MIRESDIQWWILEAKKHPDIAPTIIQELGKRLLELDAENERLRGELIRLQHNLPASGSDSRVETLRRKVETLQDILQRQEPADGSLILLSERLQAVRVPLAHARELAAERRSVLNSRAMLSLHSALWAQAGDELLILTNLGRGIRRLLADIPWLDAGDQPTAGRWPAPPEGEMEPGERPAIAIAVSASPRFWTVVTQRGYVQRLVRAACDQKIAQGEPLLKSPFRNDEPTALVSGDQSELLILTRWGTAVRFAQRAIEAQGSTALELEADDQTADALALDSSDDPGHTELLIATASGFGMRRSSADVPARTRLGSAGKALIQAHDVMSAFEYAPGGPREQELLFVTYGGALVFAATRELPLHERLSKGTLLHDLSRDPAIAVAMIP